MKSSSGGENGEYIAHSTFQLTYSLKYPIPKPISFHVFIDKYIEVQRG